MLNPRDKKILEDMEKIKSAGQPADLNKESSQTGSNTMSATQRSVDKDQDVDGELPPANSGDRSMETTLNLLDKTNLKL